MLSLILFAARRLALLGAVVLCAGCERERCMVDLNVVDRDGQWVKHCSVEVLLPEDQPCGKRRRIINEYDGPPQRVIETETHMFRFPVPMGTWVIAIAPKLAGPGIEVNADGCYTLHLYPPTPPSKALCEWRDQEIKPK